MIRFICMPIHEIDTIFLRHGSSIYMRFFVLLERRTKVKKIGIGILLIISVLLLTSCGNHKGELQKVGLITDNQIEDLSWEKRGFAGLQQIEKKYGVDVFLEENIQSESEVGKAVDDMAHRGVNLIFGQSSNYGNYFINLAKEYPNVHFVYFNGTYTSKRVSSISFQSHAMSFFAGMIAAKMSESGHVGILAAYEWQDEIEGFFEGVKYQDSDAKVHINFIEQWSDPEKGKNIYEKMLADDVDVFYPTGDSFSADIIKQAHEDDVYAIGYLEDQAKIAPSTVLTSTIQEISSVYERIADQFNEGELSGGVIRYDFADEVVRLGEFNDDIPRSFQQKIEKLINDYKDSGVLPYEE